MSIKINSQTIINGSTKLGPTSAAITDNILWDASSLTLDLGGNIITNTNVTANTSIKMIGAQSAEINGSGDLLLWPNNSNFYPGTQDFFIGAWARWTRYGTGNTNFLAGFGNGNAANTLMIAIMNPSYYGNGVTLFNSGNYSYTTGHIPSENVWHHVALSRSGTTFRLFVDGTVRGTWTISNLNLTTPFRIGSGWSNGEYLNGQVNSAQLVIGRPVVTSNFTIASPTYRVT